MAALSVERVACLGEAAPPPPRLCKSRCRANAPLRLSQGAELAVGACAPRVVGLSPSFSPFPSLSSGRNRLSDVILRVLHSCSFQPDIAQGERERVCLEKELHL